MKEKNIDNNIKNIYTEIGNRLRSARKALHLTIAQVSEKSGIKPNSIAKYETGSDRIPIENLIKICFALDINIGQVFDGYSNSITGLFSDLQIKELSKRLGSYDKIIIGGTGTQNILLDYAEKPNFEYFYVRKDTDNNNRAEFVIQCLDDTMYPAIKKKSYVGVGANEFSEGQIYLFYFPKVGLVFKRISEVTTNEITLISDNSRMMIKSKNIKLKDINEIYPGTFEKIDFDKNKIYIWGMAVWVLQEL